MEDTQHLEGPFVLTIDDQAVTCNHVTLYREYQPIPKEPGAKLVHARVALDFGFLPENNQDMDQFVELLEAASTRELKKNAPTMVCAFCGSHSFCYDRVGKCVRCAKCATVPEVTAMKCGACGSGSVRYDLDGYFWCDDCKRSWMEPTNDAT